jgi:hypothetical protein
LQHDAGVLPAKPDYKLFVRQDLDGFRASFQGPDSYTLGKIQDKNFSVSHFPGIGSFDDRFDRSFHKIIVNGNLKPYFFEKVHFLLYAPVGLRISHRITASQRVAHRQGEDFLIKQSLFDISQFVGLDHGNYIFHRVLPPSDMGA